MTNPGLNPVVASPCPNCPFRRDVQPFLALARMQEILDSLATDHSFPCHQTIDYCYADGEGRGRITEKTRICAGAVHILLAEGWHSTYLQLAERLTGWSPDRLRGRELIYPSAREVIRAHQQEE